MILGGVASALLLLVVAVVAVSTWQQIIIVKTGETSEKGRNLDRTRAFKINCFNINRFKLLFKKTDEA